MMTIERWAHDGWDEYDAFMNDNRHCGQGWIYNRDVEDPESHAENICEECRSLNIRFQFYEDCIDRDHAGTETECLDCGFCDIS